MALQFYFGPSGSGKSTTLYREVVRQAREHEDLDYLILVPEQFTMQTQKDLVLRHSDGGIMNIDVLSFGRLSFRVAEETGMGVRPVLDDIGKALIIRRIASDMSDQLPTLGRYMKRIGYINEVKSAISEFMQYSVSPDDLTEILQSRGISSSLKMKLLDLQTLYRRFIEYIGDNYITTEESMDLLARYIPRSERIQRSVVVMDGYTGFTPVQMRVVRALLNRALDVIITVPFGCEEGAEPLKELPPEHLFSLSSRMVRKILTLAEEDQIERKTDVILSERPVKRYMEAEDLAFLEEELFRYGKRTYDAQPRHITLSTMSTIREEVRQVCLSIRRLVCPSDEKAACRYRDIAIVSADPETYAPIFEEYLDRYHIPYFIDRTTPILQNPLIEYIRSALLIYDEQFSYESIFHFLRTNLAGLTEEETDRLENYVLFAGIRGPQRWSRMFSRKTTDDADYAEQELEEMNMLRKRVLDRLKPLKSAAASGKKNTSERVRDLYAFVEASGCDVLLDSLADAFEEAGDDVKCGEFRQAYRYVMELFEQIDELMGAEETDLKEFIALLDAGFAEMKVGVIPQNADRVMVGDMQRTRLDKVRHMFFCGVNDGNIPMSGGGGILSDFDREFIHSLDTELELAPTPKEEMYIQRLYLYMMMTKPLEGLHMSFCRVYADGKEISPSYLVREMTNLFPGLRIRQPEKDGDHLAQADCIEDGLAYYVELQKKYMECTDEAEKALLEKKLCSFMTAALSRSDLADRLASVDKNMRSLDLQEYLEPEAAGLLYGDELHTSVSRLEEYAGCAFRHFLNYGLALQDRSEPEADALLMGTTMHEILRYFSEHLSSIGSTWTDFTEDDAKKLIEDGLADIAGTGLLAAFDDTGRGRYQLERLKETILFCIQTIGSQLRRGSLTPELFEYQVWDSIPYGPGDRRKVSLKGTIDRVDVCREDDRILLKIVDYKSSKKELDLSRVYTGEQIQLPLYMDAIIRYYQEKEHLDDESVIPAGLLYFPLIHNYMTIDPQGEDDASVADKHRKELKMTGVVNVDETVLKRMTDTTSGSDDILHVRFTKDGIQNSPNVMDAEGFRTLRGYVRKKIGDMASEISKGAIMANPYENGCEYCPYKGTVCKFDAGLAATSCRERSVNKADALDAMKKALEEDKEDRSQT